MTTSIGGLDIIFGDHRQPRSLPLSHPKARWDGFCTETTTLPRGYQRRKGCRTLTCDILFERDVPMQLRDGTTIYVDVYRPTGESVKCPAIVAWSPYGKQGGRGNQVLDDFPFRMGVPLHKLSELQKWEGPDPAYWVEQGYAVVNPDPRGVGKSQGNIYQFGSQEGRDGADVVDWVGSRSWCSGRVALSGNSWLTISQWYIAAERPQHLAAIAPWEGFSDAYREAYAIGGVMSEKFLNFNLQLGQVNFGEGTWENTTAMALKHKEFGEYHDDKRARVENINVPAYVVASWSNPIHTWGTFCAYGRLQSEKWLRVHDAWEWPDYYQEQNVADLQRFFDHYLKGVDNDWEQTPRFRAKILDTTSPFANTGTDFQSSAFPPPEMKALQLWMDGRNNALTTQAPSASRAECTSSKDLNLTYAFAKDTVLCGPLEVYLSVSVKGADDCDFFIRCSKISKTGQVCSQLKIPYEKSYQAAAMRLANKVGVKQVKLLFYEGPKGQLRISQSEVDPALTTPGFPIHRVDRRRPVKVDEALQVQPGVTPIGMRFSAGEKLAVCISQVDTTILPPVDQATLTVEGFEHMKKGATMSIHCGSTNEMGSYIVLPVVKGGE